MSFLSMSQEVNPLVQQMNRLVEDLRLINQLKDSPYQYDSEDNRAKAEQPNSQRRAAGFPLI